MLLDYTERSPNAIICYKASNMVLHEDSDAAYITIPYARSCYSGHLYLSYWPSPKPIKTNPKRNGPIYAECKTIRKVVSSAADTETCGIFNNGKTAIGMRSALIILYYKKPATPFKWKIIRQKDLWTWEWNQNVQKHGIWNGTGRETRRCLKKLNHIVTEGRTMTLIILQT